jgi:hypothetical protein
MPCIEEERDGVYWRRVIVCGAWTAGFGFIKIPTGENTKTSLQHEIPMGEKTKTSLQHDIP